MPSKYIYGPVPSRRLKSSLGIDIIKSKTCSFNCIYCQVGSTICLSTRRRTYVPIQIVLEEIKTAISQNKRLDFLTFSGAGEPTLHIHIGKLIDGIKKITKIPVAVITNGSLLYLPSVQKDLARADVVLPTLCTATEKIFKNIHRANPCLNLRRIINGMIKFRQVFKGKLWLEIMLIKGFNDQPGEIHKLKAVVDRINPDRIQLNTVIRPPSEEFARPLNYKEMLRIRRIFGRRCEIIAEFKMRLAYKKDPGQYDLILNALQRRPMTLIDLVRTTGLNKKILNAKLNKLRILKLIKTARHDKKIYFVKNERA